MVRAKIQMPRFDEIVEGYAKLITDIDAAAVECVEYAQDVYYKEMHNRLLPHRRTGKALDALVKSQLTIKGNSIYAYVGVESKADDKDAFQGYMHAQFQEFGSPTFPKDPWMRPTVDRSKAGIRKEWIKIFQHYAGVDLSG